MGEIVAKKSARQSRTPQRRPQVSPPTSVRSIKEVENELIKSPIPEDIVKEIPEMETSQDDISEGKLLSLWDDVKKQKWAAEFTNKRLEDREQELKRSEQKLRGIQSETEGRETNLRLRETRLAEEEADLETKRVAAREGFLDERRASTKEIVGRIDALLTDAETWGAEARVRALKENAAQEEIRAAQLIALNEERELLRKHEVGVRASEERARSEADFLKEKEMIAESIAQRRIDDHKKAAEVEIEELESRLAIEREKGEAKDQILRELRNKIASFGGDPESQQRRIDDLAERLRVKEDELARRPPEEEIVNLRQLARRVDEAENAAKNWQTLYDQTNSQLRRNLVSVGEQEVLRDERDALEAQKKTLQEALAQHKSDWEELQSQANSSRPFPTCSEYDDDPKLTINQRWRDIDSLAELAEEIRDRMASNAASSFYYSASDVRIFLAGLSASRLHLLQGISGTGKTSLPREFFKALAGNEAVEIVEVQAGWRDKDDLFGFYNAFQKQFAESEFTKALYRALLPANADRPMVIVLDEMNLAHPEQYFSVMLSLLENSTAGNVAIPLLASEVPNLPALFEGSKLPLARNVWFVGTANHDETTVAFADKTYDRAHVQTLPSQYASFQPTNRGNLEPVSYDALERAFVMASKTHAREAKKTKEFLQSTVRGEFEEFGVGWGNRLERQIDRFIPVVLASGGGITEAVDHLIATKLVRKLENRFGIRPEQLEHLADAIQIHWAEFEDSSTPAKTLSALQNEAKKLRGTFGP